MILLRNQSIRQAISANKVLAALVGAFLPNALATKLKKD